LNAVRLPFTDLSVFPICLGSVALGSTMPAPDSFRLLDAYCAAGGNFIDTAKVYADWLPGERSTSENTIGAWLRARGCRDQVILSTKGGHPQPPDMHISRLSPAEIVGDLESSLRRLGTGTIDIYWLHRDDVSRPVGELLETLAAQARAGKIRYYGCSNWKTGRIREAQDYAVRHDLPGFSANQMQWSLAEIVPANMPDQTLAPMDEAMHQFHRESGLAAIPFTSQAGGLFSKLADGRLSLEASGQYASPRNARRLERIRELARQTGLSITQLVLGYLTAQPFVTVPIIGPKSLAQLADSLTAAEVKLTPQQVTFLEASG
jgi:aryl-alcohol dehydrogenase-like predicted oxidoreductase